MLVDISDIRKELNEYERDNHMYMREITDFIDKFKKA